MKHRDKGLRSLEEEIKRLESKVSEAFWDGNDSYGVDLQATLETYYDMRKQGELYIPDF